MQSTQAIRVFVICGALATITLACGTPRREVRDERIIREERVVTTAPSTSTTTSSTTTRTNDYRRRPGEELYEVPVSTVRAITGPAEKRCWVERERVTDRGSTVGGAVAGAVIGGVIGHQVGSGRGNDAATVGGAVAGGAIGAGVGRARGSEVRDVERCETTASVTPEYWDVTYNFRGVDHRVQMTAPPGNTITVNRDGEPRV